MELNISFEPTIKQGVAWIKLLDKKTKFLLFGGGAGGGKSWLGCEWLLFNCLKYPGTKWFIGREELKRLMISTYISFIKVCKFHNIPKSLWYLDGKYNFIQFTNGSRIDLLELKYLPGDPLYERLGSLEFTGGWIEEGAEVHFMAFDILKSRIGRQFNEEYGIYSKILITCNPKKNWIYNYIYRPWKKKELDKDYFFIQALYNDNPYTSKEYGENLRKIKDVITRQRLMQGLWEYEDDPSKLMDFDKINDIFTNEFIKKEGNKYMSVDPARFGQDRTVIMIWHGLFITKVFAYEKTSMTDVETKILELAEEEEIPRSNIVVDEDGIGGGIIDHITGIRGFVNNSKPLYQGEEKTNYQNLKTECYFKLAELINSNKIAAYFENESYKEFLVEDLEQVKRKDIDKDGKLRIVEKDIIRENIGRSPDFSDCMMMRMYFELAGEFRVLEDPWA